MVSNYAYPNYPQSPQPFDRMPPINVGMQAPSMQNGPVQRGIKGRPVSCFEEAKSYPIEWDGSLYVFPDLHNNRIYTKQPMLDGSCPTKCYIEQPIQQNISSQADEQSVSSKIIQELQTKVEMLEQQLKGLINEPKSNTTVPNVRTA